MDLVDVDHVAGEPVILVGSHHDELLDLLHDLELLDVSRYLLAPSPMDLFLSHCLTYMIHSFN